MNENEIHALCGVVRETSLAAHRFLRHGHNERIYESALAHRLRKQGFVVMQQQPLPVFDEDGTELGLFYADLLVERELIIELKAVSQLIDEHTAQVLGYLRASRLEHGLLINCGATVIQFKKFIFSESWQPPSKP